MLNDAQISQFERDGFIIVKDLFQKNELQPVIDEISERVDELAQRLYSEKRISSRHENACFYTRLNEIEKESPGAATWLHVQGHLGRAIAELWSHPKLLDIVEQMIGPEIAGHPVWNLRCKTPNNPLATVPWHQDCAYLLEGAENTLQPTAWIPFLDANKENGTLQVVRNDQGKHKLYDHLLEKEVGDQKSWYLYIPDEAMPRGEVVTCEVPFGSVLFLQQNIPHRSTENFSDKTRWSVDLRWQDPALPSGVDSAECILMRSQKHGMKQPSWDDLSKGTRQDIDKDNEGVEVNVAGAWLDRWAS